MSNQKTFELKVNDKKYVFENQFITGAQVLDLIGFKPTPHYEVLLKIEGKEYEPVGLDEKKDLAMPGIESFEVRLARKLEIFLDDESYTVDACFMTSVEVLALGGMKVNDYYLKRIDGHIEINYKEDEHYKIAICDKMKFSSCKKKPTPVS